MCTIEWRKLIQKDIVFYNVCTSLAKKYQFHVLLTTHTTFISRVKFAELDILSHALFGQGYYSTPWVTNTLFFLFSWKLDLIALILSFGNLAKIKNHSKMPLLHSRLLFYFFLLILKCLQQCLVITYNIISLLFWFL